MNSETDVKGSSKLDYIHLDYKDEPKNTLLKLHPGTGEAKVENKAFNKGKVGNSNNVIEFYTVKEDITKSKMIAYTIRGNHLYKSTNDFKVRLFLIICEC